VCVCVCVCVCVRVRVCVCVCVAELLLCARPLPVSVWQRMCSAILSAGFSSAESGLEKDEAL
jgi:hypothetical protein